MVEKVSILSKEPAGRGESVEKVVISSTGGRHQKSPRAEWGFGAGALHKRPAGTGPTGRSL